MRQWSEVAARIAATSRTSEKVATLADYLRSLTPDELPLAVHLHERPAIRRSVTRARRGSAGRPSRRVARVSSSTPPPGALGAAYNESSDLGQAVRDLFAKYEHAPSRPATDAARG